ncbi:MAG: thymidylate synthase [Bryobacteraceae bacterium]
MDETIQEDLHPEEQGRLPVYHVEAGSIPEAYYEALKAVHFGGHVLRTQYDRKDSDGNFIDPPGRDARVSIRIRDPFAQPRYPVLSYCERGKYIAEFLGAKDHLVVPYSELLRRVRQGEEFEATEWPYCYHQRLTAYPRSDGSTMDQLELILDKLARDPITRRAVASTRVPEIDLFMASDMPCLGEVQLRSIQDEQGRLVLNMHAMWRSRDLFKAWGDNLIGITNLQARLAARLAEKTGREVLVGPYSESNGSLHIYGQDYKSKGMDRFFTRFPTCESFVRRARSSKDLCEMEIIPQLEDLLKETTWRFPPHALSLMQEMIDDYRSGRYTP